MLHRVVRLVLVLALVYAPGLAFAQAVATYNPIFLPRAGSEPLAIRVSAPTTKDGIFPVIIFSHGNHYSKDDYLVLTENWAAHGFVVIQPTHQDAIVGGLPPSDIRQSLVWRTRIEDMNLIMNGFDVIESLIPTLRGRLDKSRVMVAGHSFGGHTVEALAGALIRDPERQDWINFGDKRIKATLIIAGPGSGGLDLTSEWAKRSPYLDDDWSTMTTPTLVIAGSQDASTMTARGPNWHEDPYRKSPPRAVNASSSLRGLSTTSAAS